MSTTKDAKPFDARQFRDVLGQYPTGVSVVTATQADGKVAGLAVGSFTSVSLDPPLVAFLPDKTSTSWPKIRSVGSFCVNVLGADQESICRTFASSLQTSLLDSAGGELAPVPPSSTEQSPGLTVTWTPYTKQVTTTSSSVGSATSTLLTPPCPFCSSTGDTGASRR